MDTSTTESPLDVLSRAATMVQDNTFNTLPPSYEEARTYLKCKESAVSAATGGKWNSKQEKRRIRTATAGSDVATAALPGHNAATTTDTSNNNLVNHPEPLDMSISNKLRGAPPSYQQSVKFIQLTAAAAAASGRPQRPSVITSLSGNLISNKCNSEKSPEDGVCDPVVDEHFLRSLGKAAYSSVFPNGNNRSNLTPNGKQNNNIVNNETVLSVDDHFAKALGEDTWLRLQLRETECKRKKRDHSSNSESSNLPLDQIQDVSTSDRTLSPTPVLSTKINEHKSATQKSLLRHDRRLQQ